MKRVVGFFACAAAAVVALLIASPASHGQGQFGPDGDITAVTAGSGILGGATRGNATVAVDKTYVQRRFTTACGGGSAVQSVDVDGVPTCISAGGGEVVQAVSTTGTINDLSLNATTTVLKFTGTSSVTLTGITGGVDGRVLKIDNSTTSTLAFSHDVTSTAANRFFLVGATSHTLQDNATVLAVYSGTDSRWHLSTYVEGVTTGGILTGGCTSGTCSLDTSITGPTILGRISGTGGTSQMTGTQATGLLDTFTSGNKGLVSASGGGTGNFARADGTWAAPPNTLGPDGNKGDVTVGGTGTTLTVNNSTITSAKLNITTTSCSAGQHVSALSAGGIGTCTADTADTAQTISGGTLTALGVNSGTTLLYWDPGANSTLQGIANGAANRRFTMVITTGWIVTIQNESGGATAANRINIGDGFDWQIRGPVTLDFSYDSGTSRWTYGAVTTRIPTVTTQGAINAGTTLTSAGNATLGAATTNTHTINGSTSLGGGAGINSFSATNANTAQTAGNAAVRGDQTGSYNTTSGALASYAVRGSATSTRSAGGNNLTNYGVHGTASGAQVNYGVFSDGDLGTTNGNLVDVGTLPTLSSCGTSSRTGGEWSWNITPGSVTACTITFAKACAAAPTCQATPYFSTTAVHFFTSVGTSSAILNITGTGWSGSQVVGVTCVCH